MERCHCGLTYQAFRSVRVSDYGDAYHQIAWTRERTSRTAVLRHWAKMKREDWAYHVETCGLGADDGPLPTEGDASFDVASLAPCDGWDEWGGDPIPGVGPARPPECPQTDGSPLDTPEAVQPMAEPVGGSLARLAQRPSLCDRLDRGRALHPGILRLRNGGSLLGGRGRRTAEWVGRNPRRPDLPRVRGPPRKTPNL